MAQRVALCAKHRQWVVGAAYELGLSVRSQRKPVARACMGYAARYSSASELLKRAPASSVVRWR